MKFLAALRRSRLPRLLLNLCLVAALFFSSKAAFAQTSTDSVQIARSAPKEQIDTPSLSVTQGVRKTVLENGLTVLTKEVHTAPVVSVQIWYRVGSRNEGPGTNGISHQLEHLLFKGTTDRPIQFGRLFSALGSASNAFTSYDQTAYFGTVGKDKLNALLVLEADRMRNALVNAEQLASEKRVVISELQGYENNPGYRLRRAVMQAAFPDRVYGLPVGGTKADVERFTIEQVRDYYQTYYSPDNAVLVVTGDFATEPVLKEIQETFGKIPKLAKVAPKPAAITSTAAKSSKAPIVLKQPGSAKLLQVVYPLPDVNHPDVPAIDLMDAILTQGRSSRFYQALVESGLVSDISAYPAELIEPGWYSIAATAAPGQELAKIDQAIQRSLADLQKRDVTPEELNRAKTQLRASFILNNRDISNQASQLAYDQTVAGDYRYSDRYLAAIAKVSAADIKRVARTYLNPAKRTVGFFEPTTPASGQPGAVAAAQTQQTTESFSPGEPVDPAEVAKYLPPIATETTSTQQLPEQLTLPNGLRVLLLSDRSTPTVTLSGQIQAGTDFDTNAKAGVASLTAANLINGTRTKDALTIAKTLADRGVSLAFSANREGVSIAGNTLTANLPVLVQTLADVVQNANFPSKELELSRQRALTALKIELDDPGQLGRRVFQQTIYPKNHPFHSFPTEASLKRISRTDIVRFHQTHYRPDTSVLALVGDFDPAQVRSLLESSLGKWKTKGKPPTLKFPTVSLPKTIVRLNPVLPDKSQSVSFLGYQGIARKDPRYYSALVLNQVLGGDTLSSRLGTEIRDRQGLTYGIYSFFQAGLHAGPFVIRMQTAPEDAQPAIASTLTLLKQFRDQGITPAELDSAKRSIINSYPVELASPDALADVILSNEVYRLSPEELRQFPDQIEAITPTQVQQAAQALIHPNNLVVVTAGAAVSPASSSQAK
jgi:zinc protease